MAPKHAHAGRRDERRRRRRAPRRRRAQARRCARRRRGSPSSARDVCALSTIGCHGAPRARPRRCRGACILGMGFARHSGAVRFPLARLPPLLAQPLSPPAALFTSACARSPSPPATLQAVPGWRKGGLEGQAADVAEDALGVRARRRGAARRAGVGGACARPPARARRLAHAAALPPRSSARRYDAYSMKTCRPLGGIVPAAENLGEHLTGETIENSAYDVGAAPDFSLAGRPPLPPLPPSSSLARATAPAYPLTFAADFYARERDVQEAVHGGDDHRRH